MAKSGENKEHLQGTAARCCSLPQYAGAAYGGLAARSISNLRLVFTKHGMFVPRSKLGGILDRWISSRYQIVAVSRPIYQVMCGWSPRGCSNVHFIPNGLNLEPYDAQPSRAMARRQLGLELNAKVLGIVGRLAVGKGHLNLLQSLSRIVQLYPDSQLLVVGDGPMRPEIEQSLHELGLSENVQMLGERHDVSSILPALDLFVLPSLTEGLPMTVLEAMASRLPVVATSVGEIPAVVGDEESGLLVQPNDVQGLTTALQRVLHDSAFASRLGFEGRRRIEELYTVARMAKQYESLYAMADSRARQSD